MGAVQLGVSGLLVKSQVGQGGGRDSECGAEKTARLGRWQKQRVEEVIDKVGGWKKRACDENVGKEKAQTSW
jgi:hypothetical protein